MKNGKTEIKFWGVRGSIPVPGKDTYKYGGNTACVSFEYNNQHIILDAGSGIRVFGKNLIEQKKFSGNRIFIFISHTHWDHLIRVSKI
jgi:phosphoribosyl 1,2-cyclic phosphodiesterase